MITSQLPSPKQPIRLSLPQSFRYYQKGVLNPEACFLIVENDYTKIWCGVNGDSLFPEHRSKLSSVRHWMWNLAISQDVAGPSSVNNAPSL